MINIIKKLAYRTLKLLMIYLIVTVKILYKLIFYLNEEIIIVVYFEPPGF